VARRVREAAMRRVRRVPAGAPRSGAGVHGLVAFGVTLLLAACAAPPSATPPHVGAPYHTDGRFLRDAAGGAILLRGVNLSGSSKTAPYDPVEMDGDGLARLDAYGPVAVRYLTTWAAIEPEQGTFDDAYLARLTANMKRLAAAGNLVLLDLHQDLFGIGFHGDGAPLWACDASEYASYTPQNPWFLGYSTPEVTACFDHLFSTPALLDEMIAALDRAVRAAMKGAGDALVGVDLLNEPWPGSDSSAAFDEGPLADYYAKAAASLSDLGVAIFFEPNVLRNEDVPTNLPRRPVPDGVYAPHFYPAQVELGSYDGDTAHLDTLIGALDAEAGSLQTPLVLGEYGPPGGATNRDAYVGDVLDDLDRRFVGAFYWDWSAEGRGLLDSSGMPRPLAQIALRPHARRVAGTPVSQVFDAQTATLTVTWTFEGEGGDTEILLPDAWYPHGVAVSAGGDAWHVDGRVLHVLPSSFLRVHRVRVAPKP